MTGNHLTNSDSRFGAWISMLNRAAQIHFTRELRPYRLGPGQQAYLLVIGEGEEVSQDELSRRLHMDKANVARSVTALIGAGYVHRRRDPTDGRRWLVRLTPAGVSVRASVEAIMKRWVESLRAQTPADEWERFLSVLETVAERAMRSAVE